MNHLATNSFIHRDLAARNVLLDSTWTGKVADFGLSRMTAASESDAEGVEMYYKSAKGTFAVRWTAPDTMETLRYTTASDVWSFGVTLFETYSGGARPYAEMDNATVIKEVQAGFRLPQPAGCPDGIYRAMTWCWNANPAARPTFAELIDALEVVSEQETANTHSSGGSALPGAEASSTTQVNANAHYLAALQHPPNAGSHNTAAASHYLASLGTANHGAAAEPPPPTEVEPTYIEVVYKRVVVAAAETEPAVSPLAGLESTPLTTLRDAVAHAMQHAPCNRPSMAPALEASLAFAENLVARGKSVGLSVDQAAALHFYSQELPAACPFYSALNGALGGWGQDGHTPAPFYLPYVKLANSAIALLPKEDGLVVYRGVRSVPLHALLRGKGVGDTLTWLAFTSATGDSDVLRDSAFLGIGAEWGARTVFKITTKTGVRIKNFSDFGADFEYYLQPVGAEGQNEDEILFSPGTRFVIDDIETYTNSITQVTMHEVVQQDEQHQQHPAAPGSIAESSFDEQTAQAVSLGAAGEMDDLGNSSTTEDPDANYLHVMSVSDVLDDGEH